MTRHPVPRFWIETDSAPKLFWNGRLDRARGFSPEFPDAKLFATRGAAYQKLLKIRERLGMGDICIRDRHESDIPGVEAV